MLRFNTNALRRRSAGAEFVALRIAHDLDLVYEHAPAGSYRYSASIMPSTLGSRPDRRRPGRPGRTPGDWSPARRGHPDLPAF